MSSIGSSIRFHHQRRLPAALPQLVMASFGGVELGTMGAGVFELTSASDDEEFVHTLRDGTVVIIPANCRYVVVRECPGVDFETTHTHSREAANLALDVYFGHGGRPLLMAHKDSPYAVVWKASGGCILRLVGRNLMTSRLRAKVQVHDADGNVIQQVPALPKAWYESLRYYRVSEASNDLYDSFRNLYMALEALLSNAVPPLTTPDGKAEGDSKWLKRALGEVGQNVNLAPYAPQSPKAHSNAIHHELYINLRTAIFHAKIGRAVWAPQDWSSRPILLAARVRYARLFRALAAEYLKTPYPGGGFFQAAWEEIMESTLSRQDVFVSNDPTQIDEEPAGENQLAPAGGEFRLLPTVAADDMSSDWCLGRKGVVAANLVNDTIGHVRRFGTLQDGQLAIVESLRAPLIVKDVDELQVVLLVEGRNYGAPRQDFES